jgi:hypothetical protein
VKTKFLIFSIYPIKNPQNGGQFRAKKLFNAYSTLGKSTYIAICNSLVYTVKDRSSIDIPATEDAQMLIEKNPHREQIILGQFAAKSELFQTAILKSLKKYNPDVIVLEQPFLWNAVERAKSKIPNFNPKIIYSSHNIEELHYQSLSSSDNYSSHDHKWIKETEDKLSNSADIIITTTEEDQDFFEVNFPRSTVELLPNGFEEPQKYSNSIEKQRILNKLRFKKYALFVASAHKPNIKGFEKYIGTRLGFLPPGCGIIILGTAGPVIGTQATMKENQFLDLYWSKIQLWDFATDLELAVVTEHASCVILPIDDGSGSNLKTAQALSSGLPVITTKHALRGFEFGAKSCHVKICDNVASFKESVVFALENNYEKCIHDRSPFLWKTSSLASRLKKSL